jgi:hypothetical protein
MLCSMRVSIRRKDDRDFAEQLPIPLEYMIERCRVAGVHRH